MHAPYTDHVADAFQAAEYAAGAALTCLALGLLPRRWPLRVALLGGLWLAVLAPSLGSFFEGFTGVVANAASLHAGLLAARLALLVALVLGRRLGPLLFGLAGVGFAWFLSSALVDSDLELCALHVALAGYTLGLVADARRGAPDLVTQPARDRLALAQDLGLLIVGTLAAALVSNFVLFRGTDSSDEWAYTYQAAVFAKGRLYGEVPACLPALRNYWVFWKDGRMFAQYQPGWPLFLVPFVWIKQIWLGGPAALGLLALALARLGRFAVRSFGHATAAEVRRGGLVAGGFALLSNTLLINGGSRYPHVFMAALFAFTAEAALRLGRAKDRRSALRIGACLGFFAGWIFVVRVPDAVLLAAGPLVYVGVATIRRRAHGFGLLAALGTSGLWVLFLLYTAHVQVGGWGVLPYQLGEQFHSWVKIGFSVPSAALWKWSFPLAWGAYEWWPLVPAIGILGFTLACRYGRDLRRVVLMLSLSACTTLGFYAMLEWGRGGDFGYGPRYQLVLVVPMAIGSALAVHASLHRLGDRARGLIGTGLALATLVGVLVLGGYLFPHARHLLADVMGTELAARKAGLRHAVVIIPPGVGPYGPLDVTRNLPLESYSAPVIYANDTDVTCLRRAYPNRTFYHADGRGNVKLTPLP